MKTIITYVPHGIDTKMFYPIVDGDQQWETYQSESAKIRMDNPNKFVVFWNNRNIHRKHPGDVILAYRHLCELVNANGGNAVKDCALLMHTAPVDGNGTDLPALISALCPEYPVIFSDKLVPSQTINILYNCADVTINIASNEGFGLSTAESIVAGTPIVVNVTGGLQDQCGFINPKTNTWFTPEDYIEIQTLHRKELWSTCKHGEWVKPVWPSNISVQGSVPTPYIFDDRASYRDAGNALYEWYKTDKDKRKQAGLAGRQFALNEIVGLNRESMCKFAINSINFCLDSFTPKHRYELYSA